jgi:hypothetical protein
MSDATADRPNRRTEDLLAQVSGDDVVVYATDSDQVSVLEGVDAEVWNALDGEHSLEQLSETLVRPEEEIATSLARLDDAKLLSAPLSRRIAMKRIAVGTGAVGAAALAGVIAPTAAMAASTPPPPPPVVPTITVTNVQAKFYPGILGGHSNIFLNLTLGDFPPLSLVTFTIIDVATGKQLLDIIPIDFTDLQGNGIFPNITLAFDRAKSGTIKIIATCGSKVAFTTVAFST